MLLHHGLALRRASSAQTPPMLRANDARVKTIDVLGVGFVPVVQEYALLIVPDPFTTTPHDSVGCPRAATTGIIPAGKSS
jgi:hypothetical protein